MPDDGQFRIFVSYRHDDTAGHVLALLHSLRQAFGHRQVVRGTGGRARGEEDYDAVVRRELDSCSVLLAVIGREWLGPTDSKDGRRLEDPHDSSRLEIATALRNKTVLVVPVLVNGASMPPMAVLPPEMAELAFRNAFDMSDSRWSADVDQLIKRIKLAGVPSLLDQNGQVPTFEPKLTGKATTPSELSNVKAFLCHSSADKNAVRVLYQQLKSHGFSPWLDEEDLVPGQNWDTEIRKAVKASNVVIVCLSRGSITKTGYIQKEIQFALDAAQEIPEGTIYIIPALLEECRVPDRLSKWHWVALFEPNGLDKLTTALRMVALDRQ